MKTTQQSLLNYCFGDSNSSLLLMAYSPSGGFINHASGSVSSPNAKVVWATSESDPSGFHRDELMRLPPGELLKNKQPTGLLMHVVALRDIVEGEEITIDYGQEWLDAWKTHVKEWDPKDAHATAAELNESDDVFRTIFEEPYLSGIATACHYRFGLTADARQAESNPNNNFRQLDDATMVATIETNAPSWVDLGGRETMSGDYFRPCKIISRHNNTINNNGGEAHYYTVKMENREGHMDWDKIPDEYQHFVKNVPPKAILFIDKAGSSHQQNARAFRHAIGFPDANEMWPAAWIDMK